MVTLLDFKETLKDGLTDDGENDDPLEDDPSWYPDGSSSKWIGSWQEEEARGQLLTLSLCQLSLSGHPEIKHDQIMICMHK